MRVYILALQNRIYFAEKLLEDIKNARIISKPFVDETVTEIATDVKRRIAGADIILAIIDEKSNNSVMFNTELQLALMESRKNRNKMLIPIILDDVAVPVTIEDTLYIKCNSESEEDLEKTKLKIVRMMEHKRYIVKKQKLRENKSRTSSMVILTLAIEVFAVLFIVLLIKEPSFNIGHWDDKGIMISSLVGIMTTLSIATLSTSYLSIMKRRRQEDEEEEIEFYSRRLKRAIVPEESKQPQNNKSGNEETKKEIDVLGRMMINLEDIKEFYTWSQKQAKASFILAVSMCISGFVLMVVAILLPVVFRLSFQMSIIPAVGGAITEVIAGTALIVYRNSLSQLNHYHKALHEDERFLSSVNLLGKFSTVEARDDMLREIIRSEIQMNLAAIHENVKSDSSSIKENSKK